jgi:hypothetical protein
MPSDTGYMRGPSDAAGLTDTLMSGQTRVQKMAILGTVGGVVGHFAFKKKTVLGALVGIVGGYYLASKQNQP